MKYLVIGSGGREHAICYKLAKSKEVEFVYIWPGNDGIALEDKTVCLNLSDEKKLLEFSKKEKIDTVIIGPENYLVNGIVDKFKDIGIEVFGPDQRTSILESSKIFAKNLMKKYKVATAQFYEAYSYEEAIKYIKDLNKFPIVIKADGLAAGKGVLVAYEINEAENFCRSLFIDKIFGKSGEKVVLEEYLEGFEASIIVLCDRKKFLPLLSAKDHKQVFDNNKGPNTGGMGAVCPNPFLKDSDYEKFIKNILNPTFEAMKYENLLYKGVLFFGLMITEKGPFVLEYNVRFGDPETQAILYSLESDFNEIVQATLKGSLNQLNLKWKDGYTCAVVLASKGYPSSFQKGFEISGLENISSKVFFSAVKKSSDKILTDGGRVLTVVNNASTIRLARKKVYKDIEKIKCENFHFRKDIGIIK